MAKAPSKESSTQALRCLLCAPAEGGIGGGGGEREAHVRFNPIPPGGGGGGRKVPAPISTSENFINIRVIPTKCGHFY